MVELGRRARRDARSPCSPTCPPRSAWPIGNAVEVDRVGRGAGRRRPGRRGGADPGAGPGDARRGRPAGRRPGGGAARRPGDGLLAGDDPGAGRRPGRAAAGGRARSRWSAPTGTATSRPSTRTPSGWPPGGSARAGPARRTRSARRPAWCCTSGRATAVRAGDVLYELRAEDADADPGRAGRGRQRGADRADGPGGDAAGHRPHRLIDPLSPWRGAGHLGALLSQAKGDNRP